MDHAGIKLPMASSHFCPILHIHNTTQMCTPVGWREIQILTVDVFFYTKVIHVPFVEFPLQVHIFPKVNCDPLLGLSPN